MCHIFGKEKGLELKEVLNLKSSTLQFGLTNFFTNNTNKKKASQMEKKKEGHYSEEFELYQKLIYNLKDHIASFEKEKILDEFLYNGLDLLFLIIRLDIFSLIHPNKDDYHKIVRNLVFMLEFDQENTKISQLLIESRKRKEEKARIMLNENYLKSLHKNLFKIINIKSGVLTMFQNVGELVGFSSEKKRKAIDKIATKAPIDDKQLENNPIIKGLYQMLHSLKSLESMNPSEKTHDIQVKLKVLELLNYFNDIRQNSLLSIFMDWFTGFAKKNLSEKKNKNFNEEELQKICVNFIESEFKEKCPEIFLTGIEEIDEKNQENLFSDLLNIGKNMGRKIANLGPKNEKNLDVIQDLNAFFTVPESTKKISILPSLLLLFYRNKHPDIEKKVLRLITRLYNQREGLLHNILSLEMIFEQKEASLYNIMVEKIKDLRILVEKSELWMSRLALNPEEPKETDVKTLEMIIDLLRNLSLFLFEGVEIVDDHLIFNKEKIGLIKEKRQDLKSLQFIILKERQNIMQFSHGHLPIISLIRDCLYQFPHLILNTQSKINVLLIEMFSMAFITLRNFCLENHKNQLILYEFLDVFQEFMQFDLKQIPLICAIFSENKALLTKIDSNSLKPFLHLIENEGRQSLFLDFFLTIQTFRHETLLENQTILLNSLLPMKKITEKEHKILYSTHRDSNKNEIRFYFDDSFDNKAHLKTLLEKLEETAFQDTYRDEPFIYQAKLLEVLLMTTKGSNLMNIALNKLKKVFEVSYLIEILIEEDSFIEEKGLKANGFAFLKPTILRFLREIHFNGGNSQEYHEQKAYIQKLLDFEVNRLNLLKEKPKREFLMYFFEDFLGFIMGLYEKYMKGIKDTNNTSMDFDEMEDYSMMIGLKSAVISKKELFMGFLTQNAKKNYNNLLRISDDNNTLENEILLLKLKVSNENEEKPNLFINEIADNQLLWFFFENSHFVDISSIYLQQNKIRSLESPDNSPHKALIEENPFIKSKIKKELDLNEETLWFFFKNSLKENKAVDLELAYEKQILSEAFLKLDRNIDSPVENPLENNFNFEIFIKKIIDFIQFGFKDPENKDTILILLQVLKKMIDVNETREGLFQIQEIFRKLEVTKMILSILIENSRKTDTDLLIKILSFAASLMKKGNKNIQNEFFKIFKTSSESEHIFNKIHGFIRKEIEAIETVVRNTEKPNIQGNQSVKRKRVISKDVFREIFELSNNREGVLLKKLLSFFKHLVEGHNIEMQAYLSKQTNSRVSYDLVSDVVELLVAYYFNSSCKGLFKNIDLCIETLIGFVQGPCLENQMLLLDSPLMDMARDLFHDKNEVNIKPNNRASKKDVAEEIKLNNNNNNNNNGINNSNISPNPSPDSLLNSEAPSPIRRPPREKTFLINNETEKKIKVLNQTQLARLQYKMMVLIMGLLEMRNMKESDLIMKKITQVIPREVLDSKILEIYQNFKKIYSKEYVMAAFGNYEEKETKNNAFEKMFQGKEYKEKQKLMKRTILESGFLMFFMICKILDAEDIDNKMNDIDRLNENKLRKNFNILGDNIIGKMANFLTTFIRSILSYMKSFSLL